jgi:phosphoglycolate phosphatase-like HAD superfamily hydrolase
MLAAVIFDMDGTLIDLSAGSPGAYIGTVKAVAGQRPVSIEVVIAAYSIGPPAAMLTHLLGASPPNGRSTNTTPACQLWRMMQRCIGASVTLWTNSASR